MMQGPGDENVAHGRVFRVLRTQGGEQPLCDGEGPSASGFLQDEIGGVEMAAGGEESMRRRDGGGPRGAGQLLHVRE